MVTAWLIAPPSQISTFHIQMETRRREWGSSTRSVSSVNPPPPPPPSLSLGRGSSSSVESVQYLTIRLFSLETKREKERTRERFLLFSLQVTKCASVSSVSHRADVRAGVDGSACTHFHVHEDLRLALTGCFTQISLPSGGVRQSRYRCCGCCKNPPEQRQLKECQPEGKKTLLMM